MPQAYQINLDIVSGKPNLLRAFQCLKIAPIEARVQCLWITGKDMDAKIFKHPGIQE
jgi:hypothetical protein